MAFSRYRIDPQINGGTQLSSASAVKLIRANIRSGQLPIVKTLVTTGLDRLDALSGAIYGDAKYWWVLAAASDVGWCLQVPAGTVIRILNLKDVERLVS